MPSYALILGLNLPRPAQLTWPCPAPWPCAPPPSPHPLTHPPRPLTHPLTHRPPAAAAAAVAMGRAARSASHRLAHALTQAEILQAYAPQHERVLRHKGMSTAGQAIPWRSTVPVGSAPAKPSTAISHARASRGKAASNAGQQTANTLLLQTDSISQRVTQQTKLPFPLYHQTNIAPERWH